MRAPQAAPKRLLTSVSTYLIAVAAVLTGVVIAIGAIIPAIGNSPAPVASSATLPKRDLPQIGGPDPSLYRTPTPSFGASETTPSYAAAAKKKAQEEFASRRQRSLAEIQREAGDAFGSAPSSSRYVPPDRITGVVH